MRLLKYGKEAKRLFFTTTLQNSVQSYSLKQSRLLEPTHNHPSPPSVFALSCSSQFLLSTSPAPLTIHLTCLTLNTPPVLLQPHCSPSAVVAAEFHPERENYFCIGFEDGTAAVYDAYHFYDSHGSGKRQDNTLTLGNSGEKAFIKGLHSGMMTKNLATFDLGADGSGGIGSKEFGISAVAFVPGRKATVVTVGADGKCCVVDFTQPTKHKAVLLRSWHIRRPATSLSIICSTKNVITGLSDGADDAEPADRHDLTDESYCIAVGSSDGRVLLFDLDGRALGEQNLGDKNAQVIDLEWTEIRSPAVRPHQNLGSGLRRSPVVKRKRKSLASSTFAETRPLQMGLVAISSNMADHPKDPLFDFTTPSKTLGAFSWETPSNQSTVALTSPRDEVQEGSSIVEVDEKNYQRPTYISSKSSNATVQRKSVPSSSQTDTKTSSSIRSSIDYRSTPPIPPRPNPKPGGRLSMRRAQMSRQPDVQSPSYQSNMTKARKVSANNPRLSKTPPVVSHSTKTKVLFGPRKPPSPQMSGALDATEDSNRHIQSEQPKDAWLDVPPETPRRATEVSSVSPATSNKSYRTAVSQPYTSDSPDRSDETVVDWTVGLPRQPVPTLQITYPSGERPSKKKGHLSLSVSSESVAGGTSTPTPLSSSSISDAVFHAPPGRSLTASPPTKIPTSLPLPPTSPPGLARIEHKAEPKQNGHVSLSISPPSSSASPNNNNSITPLLSLSSSLLSDPAGPIVQWPSLKKSPRLPDLNKVLPDPKEKKEKEKEKERYAPSSATPASSAVDGKGTESATTDSILMGYASSPSPPTSPPRVAAAPAHHASSWFVPAITTTATTHYPELEAIPPSSSLIRASNVDAQPAPASGSRRCDCDCQRNVALMLEAEIKRLRFDIEGLFEGQRVWFESLLRRTGSGEGGEFLR